MKDIISPAIWSATKLPYRPWSVRRRPFGPETVQGSQHERA